MFRRFRGLTQQNAQGNNTQIEALARAHQLYQSGQFKEAALIFAQQAQEMEASRHFRRAANLHAQAAHAYADGGDEAQALIHAKAALTQFLELRMLERAPRFYTNITNKMRARGMNNQANILMNQFGDRVGALPVSTQPLPNKPKGLLPPVCPHCGGQVRSDEVEWVDPNSAECIYCGSILQISN